MHGIFSATFQKILALSHLWWRTAKGPHNSHLMYFPFSCCLFKHSDTCLCCDGVCSANLALSLGIPCAPAVLVHTPLVKAGCCCWWLKNQVHLFLPKDATEWLYKELKRPPRLQERGNFLLWSCLVELYKGSKVRLYPKVVYRNELIPGLITDESILAEPQRSSW